MANKPPVEPEPPERFVSSFSGNLVIKKPDGTELTEAGRVMFNSEGEFVLDNTEAPKPENVTFAKKALAARATKVAEALEVPDTAKSV